MTLYQEPIWQYLQRTGGAGRRTSVLVPRIQVTVEPTADPVTLADTKVFMKVDGNADDANLQVLISAATAQIEAWTGRALMPRTLKAWYDAPPADGPIPLLYSPVSQVSSFKTYNDADTGTEVDSSIYRTDLIGEPARIALKTGATWPTDLRPTNALEITYTCGYASAAVVPKAIKQAIMMLCAQLEEGKDAQKLAEEIRSVADIPPAVLMLIRPYIIPRWDD